MSSKTTVVEITGNRKERKTTIKEEIEKDEIVLYREQTGEYGDNTKSKLFSQYRHQCIRLSHQNQHT